nr:cysteine--tRNA ligase, chloroplastic/mitochondrial isoform X2 [Ipomoea batatas]GMD42629.1 cysteine--tRNA ligase, chloroplastic/mitochondrial isoform X2 [Ipomoea batatas]GMD45774.1 cysteine--tRNA ligase, chloroplastic/mitochondrial isoform X2 [Ipomoea batatas]
MFVVSPHMISATLAMLAFTSASTFSTGRYLKHLGYEVNYVRNFTDVDDKIIARANELGEDPISLSRRYCEEFLLDMAYLHCLPPSVEPRVSDHMPQIINMIQQVLFDKF